MTHAELTRRKAAYLRMRRLLFTLSGLCHRCQKPSLDGYFCFRCRVDTSERARLQMQACRQRKRHSGASV